MNKTFNIIVVLIAVLLISCGKQRAPFTLVPEEPYEEDNNQNQEPPYWDDKNQNKDATHQEQNIPQLLYDIWSFSSQDINIPAQTTMEEAISNKYPNMRKCYNYNNVGGMKLLGEMAADKAGYNYSFYSYPINLRIPPLSELHLCFVSSPYNIICQVLNGNIEIESVTLKYGTQGMIVVIITRNLTDSNQEVSIEQGQMIEINDFHMQNLVISKGVTTHLSPKETWRCTIPVFCASHHRSAPRESSARLTPYKMISDANTLQSQQRVWEVLESNDDPNSYITFYSWDRGTITDSRRPSLTGHAFVKIPQIGIIGFGTLHGGLLDDEGHIFDHTSKVRYATDSCRIKVSDEAQKAMIKKLQQLQANIPKYRIGRYDCTSFVMDMADAGDIHYGSRTTIKTPVGFMEELKKHNYYY